MAAHQWDIRNRQGLFRHINYLSILQLISHAHFLSSRSVFVCLILRRRITLYLIAFLGYDFHIILARIFYHSIVGLTKDFGHIKSRDEGYHQGHGKHHGNVEEIADNVHRVDE